VIWVIEDGGKFEVCGRPTWKDAKEMANEFIDRSYNYVAIAQNRFDNDIALGVIEGGDKKVKCD
jgi:hypothetical protein